MNNNKRIVLEEDPPSAASEPARQPRTELQPLPPGEESVADVPDAPGQPAPDLRPTRARALIAGITLAGALLLLQTVTGLAQLLRESPLLGIAWSAAFVLLLGAAGHASWRMWKNLRRWKQHEGMRERASLLLAHNGIGEGQRFCEELAQLGKALDSPEYRRWKEQLSDTHNNREVMQLYSRQVLSAADARALERVSSNAGDVAVMVAVSYFPAVDMLLVLWRQLQLVEEVAGAYGMDPGYWGRIQLLRKVLRNMALAGAAEIATEVGVDALGAGVMGRLSAAAAQGVAAGVLTARLGLRTMDACRAIPWEPEQRPRLRQVTGAIIEKAKRHLLPD